MSVRSNLVLALLMSVAWGAFSQVSAQTRTWNYLPTGNGHGFQIFDRQQNRVTYFLEHPYRYVAPAADDRKSGIGRRDLAHDIYFGVRIGGQSKWLNKCGSADCVDYTNVEYEAQTHIIKGSTSFQNASIDTYFFAPFGYPGNGMLMLIKIRNNGNSTMTASAYAKPNLKLGNGRVDPDDSNEQIQWWGSATPPHGVETGPGGGHALYLPLTDFSQVACGTDSALYQAVLQTGEIGTSQSCQGNYQVLVFKKDFSIPAGQEAWWGVAVLFLNDNPNDGRASLFRDDRTKDQILSAWTTFAQGRDAQALHDSALAEFETWRKPTAPAGLSEVERKLWRQSEAVLRMAQIREKPGKNDGMILASLPPGEWHTGWVRDAAYAIAALALTGHIDEARRGVEFFLSAESGFFYRTPGYLTRDYRVSVCRYFGNGLEEGDYNQDGPNVEIDGWGLMLWAARLVLHQSCDKSWLNTTTWKGDTVYAALDAIAQDMENNRNNNLPRPDSSIWEVHWDRKQVFSYTTAAWIRGFYDFADVAEYYGQASRAQSLRNAAAQMLAQAKMALVHTPTQSFASHLGVAGNDVHVDGSTMGFLDWGLVGTSDPLYQGTLNSFSKLITGFGGYRRLEPQLSLTGGGSASTYDLSEWILLDLRIGDAWRRQGNTGQADALLNKVTNHAAVNDFLIPELYDKDNGSYTGVVPMVGYGAGAWMMSQLIKHGVNPPAYNAGFRHCSACASNPCTGAHEVCLEGDGGYTCGCVAGYHREGNACVADTVCDPMTTCSGHGTCADAGLECLCEPAYSGPNCADCATGYHREGNACVANTPCTPNPCTETNRNQCTVQGQGYVCGCNPGYHDEGGSCVADAVADGGPGLRDGSATICGVPGAPPAGLLLLALLVGVAFVRRLRG
jgi:hypothetical protein